MRNCPFNYSGSKSEYPELHEISIPLADIFGGGGGFWSNCKSRDIVVNDVNSELVMFQRRVYEMTDADFEVMIGTMYALTEQVKTDQDKYNRLRQEFNNTRRPTLFYALLCTCTNNMVRYNSSGGFNQTWGKRAFNKSTEAKLREFRDRILSKKITFATGSYLELPADTLKDRILFADPPYILTRASYNLQWDETDERRLYEFLKNKQFLLTNYLSKGEARNHILESAIKSYGWYVHALRGGKMRAQKTDAEFEEVLVVDSEETARLVWHDETKDPIKGII